MKKGKGCLRLAGALALIAIVIVVLGVVFLDRAILRGVNTFGPRIVGVPVTLEDAKIRFVKGEVALNNLVIGNPEGYKTEHAIKLGAFSMDMRPSSALSDRILIGDILIDGPEITYEVGLGNSNLGKILEGLESKAPAEAEQPEAADKEKVPRQKVEIDKITIQNGKIRISAKILQGKALTLPLPTITMEDIGKEKDTSLAAVITRVLKAIITTTLNVVKGSGDLVGKGVGTAVDLGKAGVGVGVGAVNKGLDATKSGLGKAVGGIKGLLGSGDKTNDTGQATSDTDAE